LKILLFSGGIDSTVLAWWLRPERLLFLDYGQVPAPGERRAAQAVASTLGLPLDIRGVDLRAFGHGTMAGSSSLNREAPEFWPYRNQILVTLAAMAYAEQQPTSILLGSVAGDEIHPDGTVSFRSAMDSLLRVQSGTRLETPAAGSSTEDLITRTAAPLSLLGWTFSCHTGEWACGTCRGCVKHEQVMAWAMRREGQADAG
jgi:7-cyano-7-deazaguanine synthase